MHRKPSGTRQRCIQVPISRKPSAPRSLRRSRTPQSLASEIQNLLNRYVHANPLRARAAMAINATADVVALYADVFRTRATVSPPLSRTEESGDGRARSDGQMGRSCIAANIKSRPLCQSKKAFQGRADRTSFTRSTRAQDRFGQSALARTVGGERREAVMRP